MSKIKETQIKLSHTHILVVLFYIFAILAAVIISLPAKAQTCSADSLSAFSQLPVQQRRSDLISKVKVIPVGVADKETVARDSMERVFSQFYVDQFRNSLDPEIPYFMLMSKNADVAMGIGGQIMVKGMFDWNGSIPTSGFNIYQIPIPKNPTSRNRLYGNVAGTGLHFVIMGRNTVIGHYMGYLEAGFNGYNYEDFKIKKAYFSFRDFTVGYTKSTFSDPAAEPQTIDGAGPNGLVGKTTILLRWMHDFKKHWSVAASLEMPGSSVAADGVNTKAVSDYTPDIAALIQYQWLGGANHVRLAGLLRWLPYRDLVDGRNHTIVGWGAQLSAIVNVMPKLAVTVLSSVGQGHGSYTGDLAQGKFDLVADGDNSGRLYAPTSVTVTAGLQYYILKNLYTNVSLGTLRYLPRHNPADDQYKYGQYLSANIFWDITSRIRCGAEYLAGKRMNFDGTHANANRLMAMFMFQF